MLGGNARGADLPIVERASRFSWPAAAYWAVPPLFALIVYWHGLMAWFQSDDFVWLNLLPQVHDLPSLLRALFEPTGHGTLRPLSERAYFLVFQSLFGFDALPFRIFAFLTMFANLALLASITRRLTGSALAGFLAPVLWIANSKMIIAMTWSCEYILIMCGFFLLLALHFFLAGRTAAMWIAFLCGFLAMETNVVFPALVAGCLLLRAPPPQWRRYLLLFIPSALFACAHLFLAPKQTAGPYAMRLDRSIFTTFYRYWRMAFEPINLTAFTGLPPSIAPLGTVVFGCALILYAGWQTRAGNRLPLLFLLWFAILLAPVLPLRDHVTDYYLTLPLMALAMLGAAAFASAWQSPWPWRVAAIALLAGYMVESIPTAYGGTRWWSQRSLTVQAMIDDVLDVHSRYPDKAIVLEGVDDSIFWAGIAHYAFLPFGLQDVYLAPGGEARIQERPETGFTIAQFTLPPEKADIPRVYYNVGTQRIRSH